MKSSSVVCGMSLLWLALAVPGHAQSQMCLTVRDPAGLPVPGARLVIEPQTASAVVHGLTSAEGRLCTKLPWGTYVVRAEKDRFAGAAAMLTLGKSALEHVFVLAIAPTASQVEVTASRLPVSLIEAPVPVVQIDRRSIEGLGARGLADALQEQPEVVTFAGGSHADGGSTNLQGFTSDDVEILVDGQPLVGRVSGYINLNQMDSSIVEAVEIKTGASAMTYGLQGLGGAVNLVTRRATTASEGAVETGYGSFNTLLSRAEGGFSAGGLSAFVAGSVQRSLGYDTDETTAVKTQSPNRVRNLFSNIYLPRWKTLSTGITALWMDQTYWGFDSGTTGIYDFDRPKERLALLPHASLALNSENLLRFRARHLYYRSAEELYYRTPQSFSHTATTQQSDGGEAEWSLVKPFGFRSFVGISYNQENIKGSSLDTEDGNADRQSWSQISSAEYTFRGRLKLQAGYRADHDSAFGGKISPQWVAAYSLGHGLSFSAAVARGFRAPSFTELYLNNTHAGGRVRVLGNTGLSPEQSWSTHVGLLYAPGRRFRVRTQFFDHRLRDMIQPTYTGREGTASVYHYLNVGEARIRGGLVSGETVVARDLRLSAAYQYLYTRDLAALTPLEYSPVHRATLGATYSNRPHDLLINVSGNLTGRTYISTTDNVDDTMRAFELFGLNIQKGLRRNLTWRVTFRNLSDDIDPDYRVTAPFSVETSLRYHFK